MDIQTLIERIKQRGALPNDRETAAMLLRFLETRPDLRQQIAVADLGYLKVVAGTYQREDEPERYEVRHAPKGGAMIGGKHFPGGEFIPAAAWARATPAEKRDFKAKKEGAGLSFKDFLAQTKHWKPGQRPIDNKPKAVEHGQHKVAGKGEPGDRGGVRAGELAAGPGPLHAGEPAGAGRGPGESGGLHGLPDRPDGERGEPGGKTGGRGDGPDDGARISAGRVDARSVAEEEPTPENPTDLSAGNFRYHDREFLARGLKTKFKANIDAIKTLHAIRAEGRTAATPEEQHAMARFLGWGQFPGVFREYGEKGFDYEERKAWQKEAEQLRGMLTREEWESARSSILNAHYTDPSVVNAHWQMAQKMGFKGGKFLETSAGIGYYLGMMPPDLAGKTRISAVEKDTITGQMLKLLYPTGRVEAQGFEEFQAPDNFYDLVASNVPFGDWGVHDPRYDKHQANVHDYFFLKSADLARPGGLIMHITSTGTLDKGDSSIRQKLAEQCDLVAAVRFPAKTHKEGAGTDVVTDMLILRKRHPGEQPASLSETPDEAKPKKPGFTGITTDSLGRTYHWENGKRVPGPDWLDTVMVPDPDGGAPIEVNKYFADHPEQILGRLDRSGEMYGPDQKNVAKTEDYEHRLQAAIDRLPDGLLKKAPKKQAFEPERLPAPGEVKDGGFHLQDGKVYIRHGGGLVQQEVSAKHAALIGDHLTVRDAIRATLNDQLQGRNADESRAALGKAYDEFVAKNGFLHSKANRQLMRSDPDGPVLLALEKWDAKSKKATKSDIFTRDTVRAVAKVDKAGSTHEALAVSLHEFGHIDIDRMAELTGYSKQKIGHELLTTGKAFEDPENGWTQSEIYLSGNVRRKLTLAQAAAATDPKYQHNVDALLKVQPEDIDHSEIEVRLGAPWVPASDIAEFAQAAVKGRDGDFHVAFLPHSGEWQAHWTNQGNGGTRHGKLAREFWATSHFEFMDLLKAALNNKPLVAYDVVGTGEDAQKVFNRDATEAAAAKVQELKEAFNKDGSGWLWDDEERRKRLHRHYNDNFNNIVEMKYDGQHQTLPGMNPAINLHPHIKNFAWRVVTTGRGLASHEVGTGKTYAMITAAMELRRLGLAKKPAIACLKANIEAITADARLLYPAAKILSTADMFDKKKRTETISRIATGDYDLIVLTHDHMNMLRMRPETRARFIRAEIGELEAAKTAYEASQEGGKVKKGDLAVKAMQKQRENLEAKLKTILGKKKDDAINFEDTGIDQLFVDEAHVFKTLPVYTKSQRVKGIPTGRSDRATNMLMRTRWLQEQNGGRGVVFATGTPIMNTIAELYNMQRFLQPEELKERGIEAFDSWVKTFADLESRYEKTTTGDYAPVTRLSLFSNLPELRQVAGQVFDVKRAAELLRDVKPGEQQDGDIEVPPGSGIWKRKVIKRPNRKDRAIVAPVGKTMASLMGDIERRANEMRAAGGKAEKGGDNMLVLCTDGRKGSIDMRLLDPNAKDDPNSKVNLAVENVLRIAKERPGMTQLIFSDVGVHEIAKSKRARVETDDDEFEGDEGDEIDEEAAAIENERASKTGFHMYNDVIDKLVKGGIPRDQIADFSQLKGKAKEEAMQGLRDGTIRVGIGGTKKMGTGVNVQNKITAMHHLDVPWFPADIEQRNGRGWRHGNENPDIDVLSYVSEGSLDEMFWQTVSRKHNFIQQFLGGSAKNMPRKMKEEDSDVLSYDQLMAAASGDPRVLTKVNLTEEVRQLEGAHRRHERDQVRFKDSIDRGLADAEGLRGQATKLRDVTKHVESHPKEFSMVIGDVAYMDRKEAAEAFDKAVESTEGSSYYGDQIGTYKGLEVWKHRGKLHLKAPDGTKIDTGSTLGSIENVVRQLPHRAQALDAHAAKAVADVEVIRGKLGGTFPKAEELKTKQEKLKALEAEIRGEKAEKSGGNKEEPKLAAQRRDLALHYARTFNTRLLIGAKVQPDEIDRATRALVNSGWAVSWDYDVGFWQTAPADVVAMGHYQRGGVCVRGRFYEPRRHAWDESKHPRGQPENAGEFGPGGNSGGGNSGKPHDHAADYKQNRTRSKAFKQWFGDWEGDPGNASKVVNANGEPQETHSIPGTGSKVMKDGKPVVVYHGTAHGGFGTFDKSKTDKDSLYGAGFYFTEDRDVAESYKAKGAAEETKGAEETKEVYLSIRKPFDADKDTFTPRQLGMAHNKENRAANKYPFPADLDEKRAAAWKQVREGAMARQEFDRLDDGWSNEALDRPLTFDQLKEHGRETGSLGDLDDDNPNMRGEYQAIGVATHISQLLAKAGYDGITHIGGDIMGGGKHHRVWIAFEPNQIKAVGNKGTFDPNNEDMHYQRGEPSRFEAAHAPKGGVHVQGKFYPGGEWIPGDVMAHATAQEKQAVGQGGGKPGAPQAKQPAPAQPATAAPTAHPLGQIHPHAPNVVVPHQSLGIGRLQMPQVPRADVPKFLEHLMSQGVKIEARDVPANQLKPTQNELDKAQMEEMAKTMPQEKLQSHVIASADGYILDGHHRWGALQMKDPGASIKANVVGLPIKDLIARANEFAPGGIRKPVTSEVPSTAERAAEILSKTAPYAQHTDIPDPESAEDAQRWLGAMRAHPYFKMAAAMMNVAEPTDKTYKDPQTGEWAPERKALHEKYIAGVLTANTKAKPGERPKMVVLMGAPGSGKSFAGRPIAKRLGVEFATVDADGAKAALPEYNGWNAGQLHEESSDMCEGAKGKGGGVIERGMKGRHHLILDMTGANAAKMKKFTEEAHKRGYDIHMVAIKFPAWKSMARAARRFMENPFGMNPVGKDGKHNEPGRYVPLHYTLENVDSKPDRTYEELKSHPAISSWTQVSTDVAMGEQPPVIDQGTKERTAPAAQYQRRSLPAIVAPCR